MLVQRVEQHIIDRQSTWYKMLEGKCHIAKNIYNHGNFLIRQEFTKTGRWMRYVEVEKLVKNNLDFPDYWEWNLANSGQQVLRRLDKDWKSFFASIRNWKENPSKYKWMPKLPKYLKKDGLAEFSLTTQQVRLKNDNLVHFPKSMNGFTLQPQFIYDERFVQFNQCRIVPKNDRIIVELIYTINIPDFVKEQKSIASIDLGLDNFVTLVDNLGNKPIIINGKGLKSCNHYYNKLIAQTKSELDRNDNSGYSHLLYSITNKRNDKIKYFMDKASKYVVENCLNLRIKTIVVGKNDLQKQNSKLKNFVQIPYGLFIQKLAYKCQEAGIELILTEESYTSGTSFLDDELPTKENYDISRRIKRGLFKSNSGKLINADVNAAYQIMKKVFHDAVKPTDIGLVLNPVRVNLSF